MKKLPIGLQDFRGLRKGGFIYIDKTKYLYQLADEGKYYFLSRPRRFGKSLILSTLAELFQGNRELFHGLWIENHWDWSQHYPVLDFRFNKSGYKISGLEAFLYEELATKADTYQIKLTKSTYPAQFEELILRLAKSYNKVVVLIDEYDKPIIDYLDNIEQAEANREILKNFYAIFKPLDPYLRFVFLTGVSKFSRVSIFSELNNLNDLTTHAKYSTMLGYTQEELEHYFEDRISSLAPQFNGKANLLDKIKSWYNGYSWDTKQYVYNPHSILSFFDRETFDNFWFETGTPTFLVKLLKNSYEYDFENVTVSSAVLSSFEIDRINPKTLLFQTGYITLKSREDEFTYTVSYPNKEVRYSLLQYLLAEYAQSFPSDMHVNARQMRDALEKSDIEGFVQSLNQLYSSIPYQLFIAKKEAYYHAVIYLALSLMGTFIQVEVSQATGRLDAVIFTANTLYVMEFKLDKRADDALQQILDKGYANPFLSQKQTIVALGLNFNSAQKCVDSWQEERLK